jgi:hypothetical protein
VRDPGGNDVAAAAHYASGADFGKFRDRPSAADGVTDEELAAVQAMLERDFDRCASARTGTAR